MMNVGRRNVGQMVCVTGLFLLFGTSAAMADYVPSKKAPKPKQQPNATTTGVRYQPPKKEAKAWWKRAIQSTGVRGQRI